MRFYIVRQVDRGKIYVTQPMLGLENVRCARIIIAGMSTNHLIRKGQLEDIKDRASSAENSFTYWLFNRGQPGSRAWLHRGSATTPAPLMQPVEPGNRIAMEGDNFIGSWPDTRIALKN
jgi:hypothetical protein